MYALPIEDPVFFDGVRLPTRNWPDSSGIVVDSIEGWAGSADVRDSREQIPGQDGEYADNSFLGGRTLTFRGIVDGSDEGDLEVNRRALNRVLKHTRDERLLQVPDPTSEYAGLTVWERIFSERYAPDLWLRMDDLANPVDAGYSADVAARSDTALYLKLGETVGAGTAVDTEAAANYTVSGNPVFGDTGAFHGFGANDTALAFDGTGDYLSRAYTAAHNPATPTVAVWFKPHASGAGTVRTWWDTRDSATGVAYGWAARATSGNVAQVSIANGVTTVSATGTSTLTVGVWHHIVATYDGTNARIYVNGVLEATSAAVTMVNNTTAPQYVGRFPSGVNQMYGSLQHLSVHSAVMTAAEISALFTKGRRLWDASGNGYHAGAVGSGHASAAGAIEGDTNAAIQFGTDATLNYGVIPYSAALNATSGSVAFWYYRDSDSAGVETICGARGSNLGMQMRISATDKAQIVTGTGATYTSVDSTTSIPAGAWTHIAATFTPTAQSIYVNGVLELTGANTYSPNLTLPWVIGASNAMTTAENISGKIDELVYDGGTVWTAAQIAEMYAVGSTGYTTEIPGYEQAYCKRVDRIGYTLKSGIHAEWIASLRASDPRIYSDVLTTEESGTTGTSTRTIDCDHTDGDYETPLTITVTGPTGSEWYVSEPDSGLRLTFAGFTVASGETVELDTALRTVVYTSTYEGVRLLKPDLIALWMLDESAGTTADNEEGTASMDGTYTGGYTLNQSGPFSGVAAVDLNGTTGYIAIPNIAALYPDDVIWEGWVNFDTVGATQCIVDNITGNQGWRFELTSATTLRVTTGFSGSTHARTITLGEAIAIDTWHHFIIRVDTFGQIAVVVDGELAYYTSSHAGFTPAAAGGMRFGATLAGASFLNGQIAAFGLYDNNGMALDLYDIAQADTSQANAHRFLEPGSTTWAHLPAEAESTLSLVSSGLDTGSQLAAEFRRARE